jgi:RimJ/RimL family protein N-acetyltransferase
VAFRAAWRRAAEEPADHSKAVVLDGAVIGTVSIEVVDGMGQPSMPLRTEAQLGYIFDPAYGGHGYATEAVTAVAAHTFDRLAFEGSSPAGRLYVRAARRDVASRDGAVGPRRPASGK